MGACYLLAFPNGKVYVGITTKTVAERFACHCRVSRMSTRNYLPLYRALRKHGPESVTTHTLAESEDWPTLCMYERMFIAFYESNKSGVGYNATSGGDGMPDVPLTDEIRAKLSRTSRERWTDPEYRERRSQTIRSRKRRALEALAASIDDYGEYAGAGIAEPVDFEDRVRVAVQASALNERDIASRTGLSFETVEGFLLRTRRAHRKTVHRLALLFSVPHEES